MSIRYPRRVPYMNKPTDTVDLSTPAPDVAPVPYADRVDRIEQPSWLVACVIGFMFGAGLAFLLCGLLQ